MYGLPPGPSTHGYFPSPELYSHDDMDMDVPGGVMNMSMVSLEGMPLHHGYDELCMDRLHMDRLHVHMDRQHAEIKPEPKKEHNSFAWRPGVGRLPALPPATATATATAIAIAIATVRPPATHTHTHARPTAVSVVGSARLQDQGPTAQPALLGRHLRPVIQACIHG
jgi:hypothetical protein